jgi:hypothetical protein
MSIASKSWLTTLIVGLLAYGFSIFYASRFSMTGSKTLFLGTYAGGCGLTALGVAGLAFVLSKKKWPTPRGIAPILALALFVCTVIGMFYGMLNW